MSNEGMKATIVKMRETWFEMDRDLEKSCMAIARRRARVKSIVLQKLMKDFRESSLNVEKDCVK